MRRFPDSWGERCHGLRSARLFERQSAHFLVGVVPSINNKKGAEYDIHVSCPVSTLNSDYTLKDSPQPHSVLAFGLVILNPESIRPSL